MEYDKNKGRLTFAHTNIDILAMDRQEFPVYNPFTPDVKPRAVRAFFWQGTDRDALYGALLVRVTDPDTGRSLYFEFDHLTAAHRENGRWAPENELWDEIMTPPQKLHLSRRKRQAEGEAVGAKRRSTRTRSGAQKKTSPLPALGFPSLLPLLGRAAPFWAYTPPEWRGATAGC